MKEQRVITAVFPLPVARQVKILAAKFDTSQSEVIRQATEEYLQKFEIPPAIEPGRVEKEGANEPNS